MRIFKTDDALSQSRFVYLKIGKLQESILDRSVFKQIHKRNDNILCKPKVGLGYQIMRTGPDTYAAAAVNTVEGTPFQVGVLAVPRGVNSLACAGVLPEGIMVSSLCLRTPRNRISER